MGGKRGVFLSAPEVVCISDHRLESLGCGMTLVSLFLIGAILSFWKLPPWPWRKVPLPIPVGRNTVANGRRVRRAPGAAYLTDLHPSLWDSAPHRNLMKECEMSLMKWVQSSHLWICRALTQSVVLNVNVPRRANEFFWVQIRSLGFTAVTSLQWVFGS